jgi:wyosine [tRNA(Phe)-imidazoG37] synthetase (radical SAM superfamily)
MLRGLVEFRSVFTGQYWLELLLLAGYTADAWELAYLTRCVDCIQPDRIQLNTVTRPPAEDFVVGVSAERMREYAPLFGPHAEVVADFHTGPNQTEFTANRADVLDLLRRRPCSIEDLVNGLGLHRNEVLKYTEELVAQGLVTCTLTNGTLFYRTPGKIFASTS